jgi:hypothetical protein
MTGRTQRARRGLLTALATLAAGLATAPAASADGDPASDVLLQQDVYYPYQDDVSPPLKAQLVDLVARAHQAGFPIKFAIIATPADLGAVPEFFNSAQRYARFLEGEIRYNRPQPLLTGMPDGFGVAAAGPHAEAILAALPRLENGDADAMTRGAIRAIPQLARAQGHRIDTHDLGGAAGRAKPGSGQTGNHPAVATHARRARSHPPLVVFLAPPLLIALAALARSTRQRIRRRGEPEADAAPRPPIEP